MRRALFRVKAPPGDRFEPGVTEGTLEILVDGDGERGVVTFRPLRSKRVYSRDLFAVARSVIQLDAAAVADFDPRPRRLPGGGR